MGLFYSLLSWVYKPQTNQHLTELKINLSASRLIKYIRLRQQQLQKMGKNIENNLLVMIAGPKNLRNIQAQKCLMNDIILNSQSFAAYQEIIRCVNIIKSQAKILQKDSSKISNQCFLVICSLVYCYGAMHLQDALKLSQFIPQPYPKINQKQITVPLQIYMKNQKPTFYQLNLYALQMCQRNHIQLEKVNEVGHNFLYNPQEIENHIQSKSSQYFAMELDPYQEKIEN